MTMSKVNIHYKINEDYKELKGILNDRVVTFYDSDFKISFDFDNLILNKSGSYNLSLNFKDCIFSFNSGQMSFSNPILIVSKNLLDNYFEISYKLEDDLINFYIDYEVI